MEIAVAVTAIGTIIFLAHLFAAFFEQSRVPDVLPLVLLGLIIGPVTGLATIQHFGEVGPVFSNLTLVIILFESGLNMKFVSLRKALKPALILGFIGFILSVMVVVATSKFLFKIPDMSALILGTTLGGTAASIAVPLLKGLNLQERTKTALVLESILGNVLSIVVTLALMTAVEKGHGFAPMLVLSDVASSFTMACIIGGIFGYMWSSLLVRIRTLSHTKFTTPACVCISYGFAEMFGFSGMLAALAFGIVMGNAERMPHSKLSSSTWLRPISLNDDERALFAELVFLLKTFFFVYLGISIQAIGVDLVYAGCIIVLWLFISRPLIVRLALPSIKTTKVDATIACIMIPRGLAAAVLASIAVSKGIEDAIILQSVAYSVVLISIAATALFSFFCERKLLTQPYRFIFTGYKEDPTPLSSQEDNHEEDYLEESILHYVEDYHHHPDPKIARERLEERKKKLKGIAARKKAEQKEEGPPLDSVEVLVKALAQDVDEDEDTKNNNNNHGEDEKSEKEKTSPSRDKVNVRARKKESKAKKKDVDKDTDKEPQKKEPTVTQTTLAAPQSSQKSSTSTVSLSHSIGPQGLGHTEIVAHHVDEDEEHSDEE